jgi:hypothetical protein
MEKIKMVSDHIHTCSVSIALLERAVAVSQLSSTLTINNIMPSHFVIGLPTSLAEEVERLHRFANDNTIIRHWLEPNFRAPHVYSDEYSKDWLECLLRITRVGKVIPVDDSCELSKLLWSSDGGENDLLNKGFQTISFQPISSV